MTRLILIVSTLLLLQCAPDDPCETIADSELKVYSNNVGIFPASIVALYPESLKKKKAKLIKDEEQRAIALAKVLMAYERDPDVLLLQEIWSIKARDALLKELVKEYPYGVYPHALTPVMQPSGLMVFSKYKLSGMTFKEFTKGEGIDKTSQKGVMGVRMSKDNRDIALFVTHLQAGGNDKTIRPDQLREINEFIGAYNGKELPVSLIAGDFNIASNGSGYQTIFDKLSGAADSFKSECSSLQTSARYDNDPAKRIDYLLTFNGVEASSVIVDPTGETISDHLSVFGLVSLD